MAMATTTNDSSTRALMRKRRLRSRTSSSRNGNGMRPQARYDVEGATDANNSDADLLRLAVPLDDRNLQRRKEQRRHVALVNEMDSLLTPRPPILEDDGCCGGHNAAAVRFPPEVENTGAHGPGPVPLGLLDGMAGRMTAEETRRVLSDVYGPNNAPPEVRVREERLAALEREICRIPPNERAALDRALACHPLIGAASLHVKVLLCEDREFRPARAARRLARYWSHREAMFGTRAYSKGALADPTFDDYMCHYDRCVRAVNDEELDDGMRDLASEYLQVIHKVKIAALDRHVSNAREEDKASLMEARMIVPEVADSDEHKLLFLKCEDFVETKAAVRMMRYWKAKHRLFGTEKLGKVITLEDVEETVFSCMAYGHLVLMPGTDSSGRGVMWKLADELIKMEGWTAEGVVSQTL